MEINEIKEKTIAIKDVLGWSRLGKFRNGDLYLSDVSNEYISHWGYSPNENGRNEWKQIQTKWTELTADERAMFEKFINLKYPKNYTVTRDKYLINFTNDDTKETLAVNLKDQKFTKINAKGKARDIKYPNTFFKGMEGRVVASKIPADDNFKKLVDVIINKESYCSNMGTFLVRMFDNFHLETYISANVKFSDRIAVGYNFFDKDVRNILNKHNVVYDNVVENFFANNHDLGKSMLAHIKDETEFVQIFRYIASDMRNINILVENYKYDVKTLFNYCKERDWTTKRNSYSGRDLVAFIADYARMAELVFPNGFDKYPKDIIDYHDGVTKLYAKEKIKYDDELYKKLIDEKLEYKNKVYTMIYPKSTGDIQNEGNKLVHCVGSYISYILKGQSIILFMRNIEEPDVPFITVEIKDKRISQARGKRNRSLTYDERMFLTEYAEKKKLTYNSNNYY